MAKIQRMNRNPNDGITGGMNPHKTRRQKGAPTDPLNLGARLGKKNKGTNIPVTKKITKIKGGY